MSDMQAIGQIADHIAVLGGGVPVYSLREYVRFREAFRELIDETKMYTIDQLDESLCQGHSQLWVSGDSAIVTGIIQYEGGARIGQVDWAVGNLPEILNDIMPMAERGLKEAGCTRIMFEGKPGWQRVLKDHGYRPHSITLVKDIA